MENFDFSKHRAFVTWRNVFLFFQFLVPRKSFNVKSNFIVQIQHN